MSLHTCLVFISDLRQKLQAPQHTFKVVAPQSNTLQQPTVQLPCTVPVKQSGE